MQVLTVIICFFLLLIITLWAYFETKTELIPVTHKVTYGETLWTIAKAYKPESISMSRYMDWVYAHNSGGLIYPGDVVIMAEVK